MLDSLLHVIFFAIQALVIVIAILIVFSGIVAISNKNKQSSNKINITHLNKHVNNLKKSIQKEIYDKKDYKTILKNNKKKTKKPKKIQIDNANNHDQIKPDSLSSTNEITRNTQDNSKIKNSNTITKKNKIYVIKFNGDIKASAGESLREEITSVLQVATQNDEVVIKLESPGGMVASYGLAASQLARIRDRKIPLTVCIDKVAASGGYMMACVADKIIAAPFSLIGSIGVVAQLPNFNKLLKKNDIDFEQITAGDYKRTLTVFGENTEEGRAKFQEEMNQIHNIFKDFIKKYRPQVDLSIIATGEYWLAAQAIDLDLVDKIGTSDDYLLDICNDSDVYEIAFKQKKSMAQKLASHTTAAIHAVITKFSNSKFM